MLEERVAQRDATIEQITNNFFKVTGEQSREIATLKVANEEQLATIKKLKTQRLLLGLGFLAAVYMACGD